MTWINRRSSSVLHSKTTHFLRAFHPLNAGKDEESSCEREKFYSPFVIGIVPRLTLSSPDTWKIFTK